MNRFDFNSRDEERKNVTVVAAIPIIERDEATANKLLCGQPYTAEDIVNCAKNLFPRYQYDFEKQFGLIENIEEFKEVFEKFAIESKKPIFVIYGKPNGSWVLFCITHDQAGKSKVLYKDPSGDPMRPNLEQKIKKKFPDAEIVSQTQKDQDHGDTSGPLCLRDLDVMMKVLQEEPDKLTQKFPEVEFSPSSALNSDKFKKVIELATKISGNEEFKVKLGEFVNKLPLKLDVMDEYHKVLAEELEKDEKDVDVEKIEAARQKFLQHQTVKDLKDNFKYNEKKGDENTRDYEMDIQKNFPEEMENLQAIFQVLDTFKVDDELSKTLDDIGALLNIDPEKLKSFYQLKKEKDVDCDDEKLTITDITEITKQLPTMKESPQTGCTPLDQLLKEVSLGMDQDDEASHHSEEDIHQLKQKYDLVKTKYENWKNSDIVAICDWSKSIKGKLGTTDDDICEAIAITDRALNLLTGGHRLRDTQILAVLVFFHDQGNRGRLCQIQTGEGKTIIVSLLAVIRVLQGVKVDVITSNPILADEGIEETQTFYHAFNLTVATNNIANNFKLGYEADVLYGTISNFQFDYLKDSFENMYIRRDRPFGQVILDEVDSMLVDNGGHIAKLAEPYPGMESFRYIYIKIWQELYKAEKSFQQETETKIKEFLKSHPDKDQAKIEFENLIDEITQNERDEIKSKIKAANPTDIPLIPTHLKNYVRDEAKVDGWIKNALHAKYNCHEHQQYRIITNDTGEKVIVPVDYLNTGVTLKNTIWSNGLHQFVQLKHNLYLTFESLTSSFISNIGYINMYENQNIFGLTGTLGSKAEQELLSSIYSVNYAKLPTYKKKKFKEDPGVVADDASWDVQLTLEVMQKIDEGRAVLLICETEQDVITVKNNFKILQNADIKIRIYANEDNVEETNEKVKIGDIIIATNIAGRGTNFKTEDDLEANGGLHVCVGFLPCNLRVEAQAFGRTSRQGNNGTAQLVIRQSEVDELGIVEADQDFAAIKNERDQLERDRLTQIKNSLVKELNFKDELFGLFSKLYRNLKKNRNKRTESFALKDLKESWAFWLEKKNFKGDTLGEATPRQEFENFKNEADGIIKGGIEHNPFYLIELAEEYLEEDNRKEADRVLGEAIDMDGRVDSMPGAHLKRFGIAIMNGEQVMERFKVAMGKLFSLDIHRNDSYKKNALRFLERAERAIKTEANYIADFLDPEKNNQDFNNIVVGDDQEPNLFLKHTSSRLYCLRMFEANVHQLIDDINYIKGGVDIGGQVPALLESLDKVFKGDRIEGIANSELWELQSIGLDSLYYLKEIRDVPPVLINAAKGQVLGGIAALVTGLCFFPIFPLMCSLAGTLISEGVMDIVMELINKGEQEFNQKDYMKSKFMTYGTSLISFGISAIKQSVTILSKAVAFCRKLSRFLREGKYLVTLCSKMADLVDKLGNYLEKLLQAAQLQKLAKAGQFNKWKNVQDVAKKVAKKNLKSMAKKVKKSIVQDKVITPLINQVFQPAIDGIKGGLKRSIETSIRKREGLMEKLRTTLKDYIDEAVDGFIATNDVGEVVKGIGFGLLGKLQNPIFEILTQSFDVLDETEQLIQYSTQFTSYLEHHLVGGDNNNDVDAIVGNISSNVADQMYSLLLDTLKDSAKLSFMIAKVKPSEESQEKKISSSSSTLGGATKDPYSVLGLSPETPIGEVRKRFRMMALTMHVDDNLEDPHAKEEFQKIGNAYRKIEKTKKN